MQKVVDDVTGRATAYLSARAGHIPMSMRTIVLHAADGGGAGELGGRESRKACQMPVLLAQRCPSLGLKVTAGVWAQYAENSNTVQCRDG